jgi:hypothetical protein
MTEALDTTTELSETCKHVWEVTDESVAEEYIHGWIKEYKSITETCKLCGATRESESKDWR